jgi:hypothetical protein
MVRLHRLPLTGFALLLSGCDIGRCIYEIRGLQASGQVIGVAADSVSANITLSEHRESDPSKEFYWAISAPAVKGHVTSAELKDAADPTHVLLSLPLGPPDRPLISENAVSTRQGLNLSGLWVVLSANRGVIELRTDLPERPVIVIPLTVTEKQNWMRPYCS